METTFTSSSAHRQATDVYTHILDRDAILNTLYGDSTTADLVKEARAVALAWRDNILIETELEPDSACVKTGILLQSLLLRASRDPIPGLGGGMTGERHTAALVVVASQQADSSASSRSADEVSDRRDGCVRRLAERWFECMLYRGEFAPSQSAAVLVTSCYSLIRHTRAQ